MHDDPMRNVHSLRDTVPPAERIAPQAICVPLADVRRAPARDAELVTQALMDVPAAAVEDRDGWTRVRLPDYEGWVRSDCLAAAPRPSGRVAVVREPRTICSIEGDLPRRLTLYASTALPLVGADTTEAGERAALPGRRYATLPAADVELRPADTPFPWRGAEAATAFALRLLDTPYLWGGVTADGTDCSGFVQLCWRLAGAIIPRDAHQQFDALMYLVARGELAAGDLLFFGREGAIAHVALSLGGDRYIHAKGDPECRVLVNSLDSAAPDYHARVASLYMGARRVVAPLRKEAR